jgi:acyl carrier protein
MLSPVSEKEYSVDTFEEIRTIISANLNVPADKIHPDSKASDFSEWDSLRHLVLVMDIEQKFDVKFSFAEIAGFDSVEKIVSIIQERVKT